MSRHSMAISFLLQDLVQSSRIAVEVHVFHFSAHHSSAPRDSFRTIRTTTASHGSTRKIYIDVICISQANGSEKAIQVDEMPCIYSATRAIVWLSAAIDNSSPIVQGFRQ